MPVIFRMLNSSDSVDRPVGFGPQGNAVRQDQPDIFQHKIVIIFNIMLQVVGLVARVEGNRDFFCLRIKIMRVHRIGIRGPLVIRSFVKDAQHVVADGHGILEEHIRLAGVKGNQGIAVYGRNRLLGNVLSVNFQIRTRTDNGCRPGQELPVRYVQTVSFRRRIFIFYPLYIRLYCLIPVADLEIIFIPGFAVKVYGRQLFRKHVARFSEQIIRFIAVRIIIFYVQPHRLNGRLSGNGFQLEGQAFLAVEGRRRIVRQRRLCHPIRKLRLIAGLFAVRNRPRRRVGIVGNHRAYELPI